MPVATFHWTHRHIGQWLQVNNFLWAGDEPTTFELQGRIRSTTAGQDPSPLAGPQELVLSTVKRRKLSRFGHACRNDMLPKIILHGSVERRRRRGRPRKSRKDNIKEWTGQSMSSLLRIAEDMRRCVATTAEASVRHQRRRLGVTDFDWLLVSNRCAIYDFLNVRYIELVQWLHVNGG